MNGQRWIVRTAVTVFLATATAIWLSSAASLGGFTAATVTNTNTARAATLSISNSLGGSGCSATASGATTPSTCTGSLYPNSATTSVAAGATNLITNAGTVSAGATTSSYRVPGCGPVSLANSISAGANGVLLPRGNAVFNPTPTTGPLSGGTGGFITLDGSTGTYAASTGATSEPLIGALGSSLGLGIWFRTTSTSTSPLFSFSASPLVSTTATSDRTLYLDPTGKIGFIAAGTATTTVGTASGVAKYNDGAWHFAYVSLSGSLVGGLTGYSVTISVDAKPVGSPTTSALLGSLSSYSGYWHAGWALNSPAAGYFAGSLAGFMVDDSGSAPTSISTVPTSYAFDTKDTQLWTMADSGGSFDGTTVGGVYTGTAYPSSAANPCSSVSVTWTLTNPAATIASGATLASLNTAQTAADPDPGGVQTSTISLSHASGINSYLIGLIVYAPVVSTYSVGTNWQVSFAWSAPAAGAVTGSTFVIR